jgi:putative ABC transport system permease protein
MPIVYVPAALETVDRRVVIVARSASNATAFADLTARLREQVRTLDGDLPLYSIETLDNVIARGRYSVRIIGLLIGLLALIGTVVSSVGLYALTAHGVTERTHEIGVRLALGAPARSVVWLFLRRVIAQLVTGLALGLLGALAVGKLLEAWLVQTDARDPLTLVAVVVLLAMVSLTASVLPARRASRVDPAVALRHE